MRQSQVQLLYKSLQLATLFLLISGMLLYVVLETYLKETKKTRTEQLQMDMDRAIAQNESDIAGKAFKVVYSADFIKDIKYIDKFKDTKSYSDNLSTYPYMVITDKENKLFLNLSEISIDDDSMKDILKLLDSKTPNKGMAIIGANLVNYMSVDIINSDKKLILAQPILSETTLNSYAKRHWDFSVYVKGKLLLTSVQDDKIIEADQIQLQEAGLNNDFSTINDNWSMVDNTGKYIRKIKLTDPNSTAMMLFDAKSVDLPIFVEMIVALPFLFCFVLILIGVHIFNYHEKKIMTPVTQLHLELAQLKASQINELKSDGWSEIKGITNNINALLKSVTKDHDAINERINKNIRDYNLIKEQVQIDEFEFYAILELTRDFIKVMESQLNKIENDEFKIDPSNTELESLKTIARSFRLRSLDQALQALDDAIKTENPIQRESMIMENYVKLIELIHQFKLIRQDIGFQIEPPRFSKHTEQDYIPAGQLRDYLRAYRPQVGNYNIVCQFDDSHKFDISSLSMLYKSLIQFEKENPNLESVDIFYDIDKNLFIIAIDHSEQLKTSV